MIPHRRPHCAGAFCSHEDCDIGDIPPESPLTSRMEAAGYIWREDAWSKVVRATVHTSREGVRYRATTTRIVTPDGRSFHQHTRIVL